MEQYEHLTDAQIEHYGEKTAGAGPDQTQQIEDHLADCPGCRARVLAFHLAQFTPVATRELAISESMTDSSPTPARRPDDPAPDWPKPDCPGEDAIRDLAAGLTPPDQAAPLIQHVAGCAHCGPILRMYTEDFSDDLTSEDQALLAQLKSSSPEWQKKLVHELQASSVAERTDAPSKSIFNLPWFRWLMVPATAAAVASIAFFVWYERRDTPEKVEKLLAQAYKEQRTTEMRWPGAAYAQMRITRGPEDSRFNKPGALLEAEGIIGRNQPAYPNDVRWLQAKAQADILERNPEAAIAGLNKALEAQPDSVALLIDLAIAYDLQAEISGDPRNLEQAIEFLGKALKKKPNNREALFNRAVLYERLKFIDSAIADWEALLKDETNQGWKEEGQKRLNSLRELKRKQGSFALPHSLDEWVAALSSDAPNIPENALEAALLDWLPQVSSAMTPKDSRILGLLTKVAAKLESQHQDKWLTDLLRSRASPHFSVAVAALQTSVLLNSQGKATDAIIPARKAQAFFLRDHNLPGFARSQLEEVYAYQRSGNGSRCLGSARSLLTHIKTSNYVWIRIQLLLNEASCFNIAGRLEEAKLDADDALSLAKNSAYSILFLRALGISASQATTRGDNSFAVKQDLDGLQTYWFGHYPVVRAYQFYSDLSFSAESTALWHLAYAADTEAVAVIAQTQNKQVEAIARYRLAKAAVINGNMVAAEYEIAKAHSLISALPRSESTQIIEIDGLLAVAKAYSSLGQYKLAADLLNRLATTPQNEDNRIVRRRLNQARGETELGLGHRSMAQKAYTDAVLISEASLGTLVDERDRLRWRSENEPSYRALTGIFLEEGRYSNALQFWEMFLSAPIRRPMTPYAEDTQASLQGMMAESVDPHFLNKARLELGTETVITYAFVSKRLAIWVLDDYGTHFNFADAQPEEIRHMALRFARECSDPATNIHDLRVDGEWLFNALIEPAAKYLRPGHVLVFETDGELDGVPFAALVDRTGTYLGESFPIVFSPGIGLRAISRKSDPLRPSDIALIVGAPKLRSEWSRILPALSSASDEAKSVARQFQNSRLLLGSEASYSAVVSQLRNARVFHYAGHSIRTSFGPAFVLAPSMGTRSEDGDVLEAVAITESQLRHLDLVVLSACTTGLGIDGRRFSSYPLLAKVPSIIVTSWAIDSQSTASLMDSFYRELLGGSSLENSLQAAASLHRIHYAHPYYWAGFSLVSRAIPIER